MHECVTISAGGYNVRSMKRYLPWWLKISAKLLASRLPVPYRTFERLGMFRHGAMTDTDYASRIFGDHLHRAYPDGNLEGAVCLELGPGDSLISALLARAHGAAHCYLVDSDAFASRDIRIYRSVADALIKQGMPVPNLADCSSLEQILEQLHATYLTRGLQSLTEIAGDSIDFIWSQAVLENVRCAEFDATLQQLARILKPDGASSHRIDLQDHLQHSLNNLRFSEALWEKQWMASSGFYTNRIRFYDMVTRFSRAGFQAAIADVDRWESLPLPRHRLHKAFADLDQEDLNVRGFNVLLRPEHAI